MSPTILIPLPTDLTPKSEGLQTPSPQTQGNLEMAIQRYQELKITGNQVKLAVVGGNGEMIKLGKNPKSKSQESLFYNFLNKAKDETDPKKSANYYRMANLLNFILEKPVSYLEQKLPWTKVYLTGLKEAEVMYDYLISRGVYPEDIICHGRGASLSWCTNTEQNILEVIELINSSKLHNPKLEVFGSEWSRNWLFLGLSSHINRAEKVFKKVLEKNGLNWQTSFYKVSGETGNSKTNSQDTLRNPLLFTILNALGYLEFYLKSFLRKN